MNRDDIIRMVKEAGFMKHFIDPEPPDWITDNCERFAALVAIHEREECARVCESAKAWEIASQYQGDIYAAAIRARGERD